MDVYYFYSFAYLSTYSLAVASSHIYFERAKFTKHRFEKKWRKHIQIGSSFVIIAMLLRSEENTIILLLFKRPLCNIYRSIVSLIFGIAVGQSHKLIV